MTFDSAADAKREIKRIVAHYKRWYPEEYKLVIEAVEMQRQMLADEKFATSLDAGRDSGMRGLYEISETLAALLTNGLNVDQTVWFKSGTKDNPNAGGRWFAKTFPEFALPTYV